MLNETFSGIFKHLVHCCLDWRHWWSRRLRRIDRSHGDNEFHWSRKIWALCSGLCHSTFRQCDLCRKQKWWSSGSSGWQWVLANPHKIFLQFSSFDFSGLDYPSCLLRVNKEQLEKKLTSRVMETRWGSTVERMDVTLNVRQAELTRDALAKGLYSRLFDYLVKVTQRKLWITNFLRIFFSDFRESMKPWKSPPEEKLTTWPWASWIFMALKFSKRTDLSNFASTTSMKNFNKSSLN